MHHHRLPRVLTATQFGGFWRIRGVVCDPSLSRVQEGSSEDRLFDSSQRTWDQSSGKVLRSLATPVLTKVVTLQSAIMAGFKVIPVKALNDGSLDLDDLRHKAELHKETLGAFMVSLALGDVVCR